MINQDNQSLYNNYNKEFAGLNNAQKQAVEAIYGPVLVLAGPGTGKTQLLALRVCNLLLQTDYFPQNILCLTYTDAGVNAMRKRLIKFMGADAYKVQIYTFHSFCNKIIKENRDYFSDYFELEMAEDIDIHEVIVDLIEDLPMDHVLKRNVGDRLYDVDRFKNLFEIMKKENFSHEYIHTKYHEYKDSLYELPEFLYVRGENKGKPKEKDIERVMNSYHFSFYASPYLSEYNRRLREKNLIDFNDAIDLVINAFKKYPDLKLRYQEFYQFILTDEYQDTNGSQNEVLFLLNDYDDKPNLFVVGDDDQAIFKFQGASMYNIAHFMEKFSPEVIMLTNNYRSHQSILDRATSLIQFNNERMVNKIPEMTKLLIQSRDIQDTDVGVEIKAYKNTKAQEIGLINQINRLKESGIAYNKICIIYRKHNEVADLIKYCTIKNIPINVKKKVNVLEEIEILKLLKLLEYISYEYKIKDSRNYLLFEILHFDFFGLSSIDISNLSLGISKMREDDNFPSWREMLLDESILKSLNVKDIKTVIKVATILENLINEVPNVTLQVLIEKILTDTKWINNIIISKDSSYRLQLINTFFDFVKQLTKKDGKCSAEQLLTVINKHNEAKIGMYYQDVSGSEDGINFVTAHSAKGLEYEYVFIINSVKEVWNKNSTNPKEVKITPNATRATGANNDEDDRRLYFVALTRAEKKCFIMIPQNDMKDKAFSPLSFLTEMDFDITDLKNEVIDELQLQDYLTSIITEIKETPTLINTKIIDEAVITLSLNPTGLNKFLRCPIEFYFENILRVPRARQARPGFGRAIHYALEMYFKEIKKLNRQSLPDKEIAINAFHYCMKKYESHFNDAEYKSYSFEGELVIKEYLERKGSKLLLPEDAIIEKTFETEINEIPIKGVIDKIEIYPGWIEVIDFKTGKYKSGNFSLPKENDNPEENSFGGDYWRQLIFYKILLDSDINFKNKLNKCSIHYLNTDDSMKEKEIVLSEDSISAVKQQIELSYQKIKNYDFSPACNECIWCTFVKDYDSKLTLTRDAY